MKRESTTLVFRFRFFSRLIVLNLFDLLSKLNHILNQGPWRWDKCTILDLNRETKQSPFDNKPCSKRKPINLSTITGIFCDVNICSFRFANDLTLIA